MKYPREEQETIIRKDALGDVWEIYTSDSVMMTKFDKMVAESGEWKQTNVITCQGDVCAKEYKCKKNLVSFRKMTKVMSEEQKELASIRMSKARQSLQSAK